VVVGPDGSLTIAFLNNGNPMLGDAGDDQCLIVRSTDGDYLGLAHDSTGQAWAAWTDACILVLGKPADDESAE
jgi:hypothetical protein